MTDPIHDAPEWATHVTIWGLMPKCRWFPDEAAARAFAARIAPGEAAEVREVGA